MWQVHRNEISPFILNYQMSMVGPVMVVALIISTLWFGSTSNQYCVRSRICVESRLMFESSRSQSIANFNASTVVPEFSKDDGVRIDRVDISEKLFNTPATAVPNV